MLISTLLLFSVHLLSNLQVCISAKATAAPPVVKAYIYKGDPKAGGKVIKFRENPGMWGNIPELMKMSKIDEFDRICVVGSWLIYQEIEFRVPSLDKVFLLTADAGATDSCATRDEIGGKLGSMQHIQSYSNRTERTAVFFQSENFEGPAMRFFGKKEKLVNEEPTPGTPVNSMIFFRSKWYLELTDESKFCMTTPSAKDQLYVCYLTNVKDDSKVKSNMIQKAVRGCTKNPTVATVDMKGCFKFESRLSKFEEMWPFEPPVKNETVPTTPGPPPGCEKDSTNATIDDEFRELIKARQNGSLVSGDYLKAVMNPKNIWKMELFNRVFDVTLELCESNVIEKEYMQIFAALYIYHMDKAWESGAFLNTSLTEENWREMMYDMATCKRKIQETGYYFDREKTAKEISGYRKLSDIKAMPDKYLGFRPDFDHVMEINWYLANLAAAACHRALKFDVNFYPRFLNIYHELYFLPIMEQWSNPNKFPKIYRYLFGGFGMEKSIVKIALCAHNVMMASGLDSPYPRPMEQHDKILLPRIVQR